MKKRIVLHFPKQQVDKPLIYRLVKDFDLEFNILRAEVDSEEGVMVLEMKGSDEQYRRGIDYLRGEGLTIQPLSKDVARDTDKCVDCTVCTSLCPTGALAVDPQTRQVGFSQEKCIACGVCIKCCPYGAMTIRF